MEGRQSYKLRDVDRLDQVSGRYLVVYDIETCTGWVVPEISFVWHLSVEWVRQQGSRAPAIPLVDAGPNNEQLVMDHVKRNWRTQIGTDLDNSVITVGDRINLFLGMIQHRRDSEIARKCDMSTRLFRKRLSRNSLELLAWDLSEIMAFSFLAERRRVPIQTGKRLWQSLLSDQKDLLVICGRQVGAPIRPAPSMAHHLCPGCRIVPPNRECLVSMVRYLHRFPHLENGFINGQKHEDTFVACTHQFSNAFQRRVQWIAESSCSKRLTVGEGGAVVFGQAEKFAHDCCRPMFTAPVMPSLSQPATPSDDVRATSQIANVNGR